MKDWVQWIVASVSAGVGGTFFLLTYVHVNYPTYEVMRQHERQPHNGSISKDRYLEDIRYLREQMTEINRKLDRMAVRSPRR
jgi:hypothetical protein